MKKLTDHRKAEEELAKFALTLPETTAGLGWPPTRAMRVRNKMFCVFGDRGETLDQFTMLVKLPIAAEMVQELWFVKESKGWFKQHDWVWAHFGPDDDVFEEIETLKAWITQSYCAMAPKKLAKLLRGDP